MDQSRKLAANASRPAVSSRLAPLGRAATLVGLLFVTPASIAAAPQAPAAAPAADPERPEFSGAVFLSEAWPDHPEWLAMLADVLIKGNQIGGRDGWFLKGGAQTRFDWDATRKALDRDGDGSVSRPEFAGPDADFGRLDRDGDDALTAADFEFSARSAAPSPGALLFRKADRDGNGKVTRAEIDAFFGEADSGGLGFLSQSDLLAAFAPPPAREAQPAPAGASGAPSRLTLLKSYFRRELGAFPPGPDLDQDAPDFTLRAVDGGAEVTLSELVGPKPVVLVFGNFTCGPFRGQAGNLEKLYRRYEDRATFVMVYVREAHPTDGWRMANNDRVGVATRQPRSYAERVGVAQQCSTTLGLGFPMLVDTIDDEVNDLYSGIPSRFYLIDGRGKVAYKSGRGPFGFKPDEMEHSLLLLLAQEATSETPSAGAPSHTKAAGSTAGPGPRR